MFLWEPLVNLWSGAPMVDIPFLLGGGGASLAGPQREQQHSHVGPLPCGVFAGQAPLILVDSILILSSCCFRISICAVYLPMYNCGLCSYIHIYIYTHIPVQVHIPFSTGCWAIFYGFFAYPNAKPGEQCLALPPHWYNCRGCYILFLSFNGHSRYRCIGGT
jgi:hypothetical protein